MCNKSVPIGGASTCARRRCALGVLSRSDRRLDCPLMRTQLRRSFGPRPCVRRASILQFECLALLECARFVVSFPFPYLPTVLVSTFIPELTVFVVTSPRDEVAACVLKDRDNNGSRRREFAITGLAPTRHSRRESPQPPRDRTPGQGLQVPRPHVVWRSGRRSMESPAA